MGRRVTLERGVGATGGRDVDCESFGGVVDGGGGEGELANGYLSCRLVLEERGE